MKVLITFILFFISASGIQAQIDAAQVVKQRVLFVLDGSGSMTATWGTETKFDVAKKMLLQLADSIALSGESVELGIRIFGHQSPKSEYNCLDSNLEIPFSSTFELGFKEVLQNVIPQGHTPIAYSLLQSANDFPEDPNVINSIILITDGIENCEGNPCEASEYLQQKRITINPFIIGLDIAESEAANFDCIGTFLNAKDAQTFQKVLTQTVNKATAETTVEINLKSAQGSFITNTALSLIDGYTGNYIYNFIHAITKQGTSDTIKIDPRGTYTIQVHMKPDLFVNGITLVPGQHNIINIPITKGFLTFDHKQQYDEQAAHYLIKEDASDEILMAYKLRNEQLLMGKYLIATSFYPIQLAPQSYIPLESSLIKKIPANGKLSIENNKSVLASIYQKRDNHYQLIFDLGAINSDIPLKLQPGNYTIVYASIDSKNSEETARQSFVIVSEKTTVVTLK